MIEAIAELGDYIGKKENIEGSDCYVENHFITKKPLIAMIEIQIDEGNVSLKDVTHKKYEDDDYKRLLYKKPPAQGKGYSPSIIYQNINKTLQKKIIPLFTQKYEFLSDEQNVELQKISKVLEENKDYIEGNVEELKKSDPKSYIVLTTIINGHFPKEISYLKEIFLNLLKGKLGERYENQACSCCGRIKEVYEKGFPFKFFTLDKPGYAYKMNPSNQYKMIPVCENCSLNLQIGMGYLKENLQYRFYGMQYLLVPQFLLGIDKNILRLIIEVGEFSSGEKQGERRHFSEERIFRKIRDNLEDSVSFTLFFFNEGQQFIIHRVIEDIFPSRFNRIFEEIDKINEDQFIDSAASVYNRFSFGTLRHFFPKGRSKNDDKFMDIVSSVLIDRKIDYYTIAKQLISRIIEEYNKEEKEIYKYSILRRNTISAFQVIRFLLNLQLFQNYNDGDIMENMVQGKKTEKINSFLNSNEDFYNTNEKRASFLVGVMVNEVLNAQSKELGSKPFIKHLKGFNLDFRGLKEVFNKSYEKLEQYDKLRFNQDLVGEISQYFGGSGHEWKLSNVDTTFFFLQGLSIANHLIFGKDDTEDENDE